MKIKTIDFYKDISKDVNKWFDTSNFDKKDNILLEVGVNNKIIGKFKDELGGKVMSEFCALRPKSYSYEIDNSNIEVKEAKGTKKCIVKKDIIFKNYKDSLFKNKKVMRSQQRFRSYDHVIYTEKVHKIALSSDDKGICGFDKVTTYPYGSNAFEVCEEEMLIKNKVLVIIIIKKRNIKRVSN